MGDCTCSCLASSSSWSVGFRPAPAPTGVVWGGAAITREFRWAWLGGVLGLEPAPAPPSALLSWSCTWLGGGGRGRCGGGPGGVAWPPSSLPGTIGGREGGPGSGISSFLLLLRWASGGAATFLAAAAAAFSATAWAALVESWMAWKFFLRVFSPGA